MLRSKLLSLGVVAGMAIASTANAAPVTQNFSGLAFNGTSNGGSWTVIHPSAHAMDGTGIQLKELSDSYVDNFDTNLNYSITWDDADGDYTDAGALDGATISFEETDFLFNQKSGVGDFILRLEASTLNINNASIPAANKNSATPFGKVDPEYGLTGVLDFVILDLSLNVLFDSQFNLPGGNGSGGGVGDLNSSLFNGLGVGTANGPAGDIAMFIWAASADPVDTSTWTDWNSSWDPLLGIDIAMWGQGVPVPGAAFLLGFGLLGIAGLRRKA